MPLMLGIQEQDEIKVTHQGESILITYCHHNDCWRLVFDGPKSFQIDRGDREEAKARRIKAKTERGMIGN